jgi:hypothetical protein
LQGDCFCIEDERRIKKAAKATNATAINRMAFFLLKGVGFLKDEDKNEKLLSF